MRYFEETRQLTPVPKPRDKRVADDPFAVHHSSESQHVKLPSSSDQMVRVPRVQPHPLAAALQNPSTRFRLPEFNKVKAAYTDKDLKIPESVIQSRVGELLERMAREKRLKSSDPVPTILARIFPSPGKLDEAEFNKAIDPADRKEIYMNPAEADSKVKPVDRAGLKGFISDSQKLIRNAQADATGLNEVFGAEAAKAKANYAKADTALDEVAKNLDLHVTTDYNLDDPEVNLGGWANFSDQKVHFLASVVQAKTAGDIAEAKVTIVHESAHLSDGSVIDQGYYGSPGFESKPETTKVANAAHYEELPRRELKISKFPGAFTPGVKKGGKKATREDLIQEAASEYLRKAWDAGVDTHTLIRQLRLEYLSGSTSNFTKRKAFILEISKVMDLTIHEQAAGKQLVTTLDVTLSESVARAVGLIGSLANKVPFPAPGKFTDLELRDQIIDAAVVKYGKLLQDPKRDKALLDWLVTHYQSVL